LIGAESLLRMTDPASARRVVAQDALEAVSGCARLLFTNGQTTEKTLAAVQQMACGLGYRASVFPHWGELTVRIEDDSGSLYDLSGAEPAGVDLSKVAATMRVSDEVAAGKCDVSAAKGALEAISCRPPIRLLRFALMAAAGAAALGVVFGANHLLTLILIAVSAGTGACLRRWLAGKSHNLFLQPFGAALLAGIIGAVAVRLQLSSFLRLVAVCPCMVLVPGPHLLNGALDLVRARIGLGIARVTYATLITLAICVGLILGLAIGHVNLPASGTSPPIPLAYDMVAAGVAVAAYGAFFNMPWRMLPIPIAVGILAHASHWMAMAWAGASVVTGAFLACLLVSVIMTPTANYLRLPFAGLAFACVVSLIPGVYIFRMVAGAIDLATLGSEPSGGLLDQVAADGISACFILLAMALGLVLPKMGIEHFATAKARAVR
jgi:uncharacterized membrane protein YjjP (DUF1212 family)